MLMSCYVITVTEKTQWMGTRAREGVNMLTQQIFGRQTYLARILCICLHLSILSNGWMLFASKEDLLSGPSSSPPTLIPLSLAKPSSMDRSVRPYCRTAHCSSIVAPRHSLLCEWSGKKRIPARRVEKTPTWNLSKRIAANDPYSLLHRSHFLLPSPDKMSQWLLMLYVYLYRFLCKRAVPLTNNCLWEPDATRKLVYLFTCFHFSVVTFRAHFSKFFFAPLWWILLDCWLRFATVSTGCERQWYVRKGRPRTHCQELGQCKWFASH